MAELDDNIEDSSYSNLSDSQELFNTVIVNSTDTSLRDLNEEIEKEIVELHLHGDVNVLRTSEVALYEIAVEAQPDLVFESDMISVNQEQITLAQPRVYLEKESYNSQGSLSNIDVSFIVIHEIFSHIRNSPIYNLN